MKNNDRERELDRILEGGTGPADEETRALKQIADDIRGELDAPIPSARRDRALFISGVAARRVSPWRSSALSALAAGTAVVIALLLLGEGALPGQPLYNLSKALRLADSQVKIVDRRIAEAEGLADDADEALDAGQLGRAESLAYKAMARGWLAEVLLPQVDPDERAERRDAVHDVYDDAVAVLVDVNQARGEAEEERQEGSDDNSGPGSDDSGSDDDSSGSGSGTDDDSSGPGSGTDDDSSGPGSGTDDDSSGPGSGSDGDSSGPGSGSDDDSSGSGSGTDDDSSGSGSGTDDDSSGSGSGTDGDSSGPGSGSDDDDNSGSG